jgi:hypothetical protein
MPRPPVDIVVPFLGGDAELRDLLVRLRAVRREPGDTLTVVDNRPEGAAPEGEVVPAPERQSSYFARNRGVARGAAEWIVFLDADVEPAADLLDRYFEPPPPGERTGVLAGSVEATAAPGGGLVTRFGLLQRHLEVAGEDGPGGREHALTANLAVRRAAFDAVGGFADDIRSGGDADLCFRIQDAGWALERRAAAGVSHATRATLPALLRAFFRYGSGAQWLSERYPGFQPPGSLPRVLAAVLATAVRVPRAAARGGRDAALVRALEPLCGLAFELGRFLPNEVGGGWAETLRRVRHARAARRRSRQRG